MTVIAIGRAEGDELLHVPAVADKNRLAAERARRERSQP
jgi:hypothetical protein